MDSFAETLKELGLGKNEIKVYITLIKEGTLAIPDIAKKSSVHRVNVYDSIRQLIEIGMVSYKEIEKKKYYSATNPKNLTLILKQKEEKIKAIIPQLETFYHESENKAQIFEGLDGIKKILNDMLEVGEKIQAFGIPKSMPELLKNFLIVFHRERIIKKIPILHIYNENAKERINYLNKIKYSQAKYLPPKYSVPSTTVIYGTKTAFWIWSETPFCVLIESERMANAYKKYFELLWDLAKKPS